MPRPEATIATASNIAERVQRIEHGPFPPLSLHGRDSRSKSFSHSIPNASPLPNWRGRAPRRSPSIRQRRPPDLRGNEQARKLALRLIHNPPMVLRSRDSVGGVKAGEHKYTA